MEIVTNNSDILTYENKSSFDLDCMVREDGESHQDFFHFLLYGVFLNTVGILGLIGNVISITILSRPNMRSSINCCLVGLASFDTILLTTSLLMFGLPAIPEYTGAMMWYQKDVFPWTTLVAYPLGIFAQTGSVYLTVTVTVERYVAVCHPLKARSLCTFGRAKLYVMTVALFSLFYNLPRFWEVTYKNCDSPEGEFTTIVMTALRQSDSYIQIYITYLYLVVMYLFPFLSLLVFNIFIYKQIRRVRDFGVSLIQRSSQDGEVRLANHERQRLSRLQKKELGLAVMLLCVVVVFFLCNILAFIVNVLEMFGIAIAYLTMINNFLVTVNSSVNFVIYCIFGQKFRRLFLQIFCFGALDSYLGTDGPLLESGAQGNSLYGGEGRNQSNGRSTHTRSIRLSSWGGSQNRRLSTQAGGALNNANGSGWGGGRGVMSVIGGHHQYRNVPLQDENGRNGSSRMNTITVPTIISPCMEQIDSKEEKSDIV